MVQWKGKWTSDFFHFTVNDLKQFLDENDITIDELIEEKKRNDEEKKIAKKNRISNLSFYK